MRTRLPLPVLLLFAAISLWSAPHDARAAAVTPVLALPAGRATLELHAHLFMKEGMTWAFRGVFDGPLKASDYTHRFSSQANPEALDRSEIGVLVATLYAHPLFTMSLRDSVRRQIAQAERFVAEHPEWALARDAGEARAALRQSRRVLVLALEGASGILESEEDLREFVDEKGLRIVNLLHLTDDEYGGVAFMTGLKILASPWAFLTQLFSPSRDTQGFRVNANGLTPAGRAMAEKLIKRGVWIDLAHSSDISQRELAELFKKPDLAPGAALPNGLPHLHTHTTLRANLGSERGISPEQLAAVRTTDGVVGLMPSDDMLGPTEVAAPDCPAACAGRCRGGIFSLATQYRAMTGVLEAKRVAFGSDYNGGVLHLPPPSCPLGTALDSQGLWNIGQQAAVWDSLERIGLPVPQSRPAMIEQFLSAWSRVRPPTPQLKGY